MDKLLVLINGLPGSGKSTLGRALAATLNAQFLSKDAVKEALAAYVYDREVGAELGGVAMDTVWALARAVPQSVVIDSWWFKPRDLRYAAAGIETVRADRVVEVWCRVPADTARQRYMTRRRSDLYRDRQRLADHWETWAEQAEPLGLAPTVFVDTTQPVDCAELAARIELASTGYQRATPGYPTPEACCRRR
ncbi:AAA family ATPase [Nocardia carnea]|uniref:AAA family ATPase n=1 Tax=Nocardia carnea TaxID=37328 RepID=UPI002455C7E8|nr:AAA family ATPase [Nocardia carnea]